MRRGDSDVLRKVERLKRDRNWRSHPVPYGSTEYPWSVPPLPCAACGTRDGQPYRTLRTEQGQVLVLHVECGRLLSARLEASEVSH